MTDIGPHQMIEGDPHLMTGAEMTGEPRLMIEGGVHRLMRDEEFHLTTGAGNPMIGGETLLMIEKEEPHLMTADYLIEIELLVTGMYYTQAIDILYIFW